jgi:hypothetical protein
MELPLYSQRGKELLKNLFIQLRSLYKYLV